MIKELKYNGYTAVPSDYECQDGTLAVSLNLISEENHLRPLMQPETMMTLDENQNAVFIHETSSYCHILIHDKGKRELLWRDKNDSTTTKIGTFYNIIGMNSVGNTLIILTKDSLIYYLWKNETYKLLGDHLPNLEISFGLKGNPRFWSVSSDSKSKFTIEFDGIREGELYNTWSENNKKRITSQVMAKVNKFLREQSVNKGCFALPFLLRYALRLYDGSLVCHSAPILMTPATKNAPLVIWDKITGKDEYTNAECDIMIVSAILDYQPVNDTGADFANLTKNWGDIIKSVDVFVSAPIYTFDQNGECSSFSDTNAFDTKFIGALNPTGYIPNNYQAREDNIILPVKVNDRELIPAPYSNWYNDGGLSNIYCEWSYSKLYELYKSNVRTFPGMSINMPEYSSDKIKESIENTSNFYLLHSIPLSELATDERKKILVGDNYMQSLLTREVMTDDYLSHDRIIATYSHNYNSRLNLAGVKRELFRGFYPSSMFAYCNNSIVEYIPEKNNTRRIILKTDYFGADWMSMTVYIKENGETYSVTCSDTMKLGLYYSSTVYPSQEDATAGTNGVLQKMSWGCFVFYPNVNAYKIVIQYFSHYYAIDLKPHGFLNGAYGLIDFELQRETNVSSLGEETTESTIIDVPNKIYTSEVNNPFFFPVTGINTVGTGNILGISSAAKALSQGQFGQFPLYAFTTDGVWALEVGATGTYTAKQTVTRDVCINPDSITQLDSSVLFATDRGIMLISGSETDCLTDIINATHPFNAMTLPCMDKLHRMVGHNADTCFPTIPFLDFLKECGIIYDYVHQHIVVYNKNYSYAYVYSLKSKQWGMMHSQLYSSLNSYPDALAMTNGNRLVSFSKTETADIDGMFITRPLKLDMPDVHKTIDTIIQRGHFRKGNVKSVLYGSRDLYNWHLVWSSTDHFLRGFRGTPYKYFRIACITSLSEDENIYGASISFSQRMANQLR